jgi:hypothetical protein
MPLPGTTRGAASVVRRLVTVRRVATLTCREGGVMTGVPTVGDGLGLAEQRLCCEKLSRPRARQTLLPSLRLLVYCRILSSAASRALHLCTGHGPPHGICCLGPRAMRIRRLSCSRPPTMDSRIIEKRVCSLTRATSLGQKLCHNACCYGEPGGARERSLEPSWEKGYNGRHLQPFPP